MLRLPKDSVGKFVRILFDDVGARDGIVVHLDDDRKSFRFFELYTDYHQGVEASQVVKIGKHVTAINSGL